MIAKINAQKILKKTRKIRQPVPHNLEINRRIFTECGMVGRKETTVTSVKHHQV